MSKDGLYWDESQDLESRVEDLLGRLTLDEKIKLCSGNDRWHTVPIKRLGIEEFGMSDGPHGVAPHSSGNKETTYFPTSICMGASWNPKLAEDFGKALAQEVRAIGSHMILGPGVNIDRTPLNGRTFEYMTEDPFLDSKMVIPIVKGVQSQRIAACTKHFICNNQETRRFSYSAIVSERVLREIYMPAFRAAVEEADSWGIMSSYNKINDIYGSENKHFLTDVLMEEWGFRGFVVSDWGATKPTTGAAGCINAGLSLEMPRNHKLKLKKVKKGLLKGNISQEKLDDNVRRLLRVMILTGMFDDPKLIPEGSINTQEHQEIARKIAEEGITLLKNENHQLPLDLTKVKKIAVIGPNADKKMALGGGSSQIKASYEITPLAGIKAKCKDTVEFVQDLTQADVVIYVGGINHDRYFDGEGRDRKTMDFPIDQVEAIKAAATQNKNIVVILVNGSPLVMDEWINAVPSVIEAWYSGMKGGDVLADIIFGDINPSGKLPLTFPKKLSDSPAHKSKKTYPGRKRVIYEEGIFVGYRFYDTFEVKPLFPFGHGLSYTDFEYSALSLSSPTMSESQSCKISCTIKNVGVLAGAEIVQLYIQDIECSQKRPVKELKGFSKIFLKPNEEQELTFEIDHSALSFFDETQKKWIAEAGEFKILIGSSSQDIRLTGSLQYN